MRKLEEHKPAMNVSKYIRETLKLSQDLPFKTKVISLKKNEYIKAKSEIEDNIYFLISGVVESGKTRRGQNIIIEFYFSGDFFCDVYSLITRKKSDGYLSCITDCIVEIIPYNLILKAYDDNSLIANQFVRHLAEVNLVKRILKEGNIHKPAKERYMTLVSKRPEIIKSIPIAKIANYLGIEPNSLSRIRNSVK